MLGFETGFAAPPNGVGAFVDIGGNADALLVLGFATGLAAPPNGVGAFVDIGGNADALLVLGFETGFAAPPNGVGAFVDNGGNIGALTFVDALISGFSDFEVEVALKENPPSLTDSVGAGGAFNEKPIEGEDAGIVVLDVGAPNEKPPTLGPPAPDVEGAAPKVKPPLLPVVPGPVLGAPLGAPVALNVKPPPPPPVEDAPDALNVKPPLLDTPAALVPFPPSSLSALSSCPDLTVSHATHFETFISFITMHASHFHISFFDAKMFPHPSDTGTELDLSSAPSPPSSSSPE